MIKMTEESMKEPIEIPDDYYEQNLKPNQDSRLNDEKNISINEYHNANDPNYVNLLQKKIRLQANRLIEFHKYKLICENIINLINPDQKFPLVESDIEYYKMNFYSDIRSKQLTGSKSNFKQNEKIPGNQKKYNFSQKDNQNNESLMNCNRSVSFLEYPRPEKLSFDNLKEVYLNLLSNFKEMYYEKEKVLEALNQETILSEQQKNYIEILKQTIDLTINRIGLTKAIQQYKNSIFDTKNYTNIDFLTDFTQIKIERDNLKQEASKLSYQLNEQMKELDYLRKSFEKVEIKKQNKDLERKQTEINKNNINLIENEKKELVKKIEQLNEDIQNLCKKLESQEGEKILLIESIDKLNGKLENAILIEQEFEKIKNEYEKIVINSTDDYNKLKDKHYENEKLNIIINEKDIEMLELKKKFYEKESEYSKKIENLNLELGVKVHELNSLKGDNQMKIEKIIKIEEKYDKINEENVQLLKKIEEKYLEISNLAHSQQEFSNQIKIRDEQVKILESENDRKIKELIAIIDNMKKEIELKENLNLELIENTKKNEELFNIKTSDFEEKMKKSADERLQIEKQYETYKISSQTEILNSKNEIIRLLKEIEMLKDDFLKQKIEIKEIQKNENVILDKEPSMNDKLHDLEFIKRNSMNDHIINVNQTNEFTLRNQTKDDKEVGTNEDENDYKYEKEIIYLRNIIDELNKKLNKYENMIISQISSKGDSKNQSNILSNESDLRIIQEMEMKLKNCYEIFSNEKRELISKIDNLYCELDRVEISRRKLFEENELLKNSQQKFSEPKYNINEIKTLVHSCLSIAKKFIEKISTHDEFSKKVNTLSSNLKHYFNFSISHSNEFSLSDGLRSLEEWMIMMCKDLEGFFSSLMENSDNVYDSRNELMNEILQLREIEKTLLNENSKLKNQILQRNSNTQGKDEDEVNFSMKFLHKLIFKLVNILSSQDISSYFEQMINTNNQIYHLIKEKSRITYKLDEIEYDTQRNNIQTEERYFTEENINKEKKILNNHLFELDRSIREKKKILKKFENELLHLENEFKEKFNMFDQFEKELVKYKEQVEYLNLQINRKNQINQCESFNHSNEVSNLKSRKFDFSTNISNSFNKNESVSFTRTKNLNQSGGFIEKKK